MAREIRLDIGDYANSRWRSCCVLRCWKLTHCSRLLAQLTLGRFRASWQVGENAAPGGIVPPGDYGTAPPLTRIGYGQEKMGNIYSVHNNLPYAEPLANGSSKQANAGWVQGIAKDVQGRVIAAAARIGRES
jgi:hypothetical protein